MSHIANVDTCEDSLGDQDDYQQVQNRGTKIRFVDERAIYDKTVSTTETPLSGWQAEAVR